TVWSYAGTATHSPPHRPSERVAGPWQLPIPCRDTRPPKRDQDTRPDEFRHGRRGGVSHAFPATYDTRGTMRRSPPSAHGNVTARACHGSVLRRTTYHTSRTFVSGVENSYDSKGARRLAARWLCHSRPAIRTRVTPARGTTYRSMMCRRTGAASWAMPWRMRQAVYAAENSRDSTPSQRSGV